jgi:hypothetical protein
MDVGDVLIAREGVADEDRVGARGVQLAIGLVGDLPGAEGDAGVQLQGLGGPEPLEGA